MGGRVAGWLREELINEPLADTEAEATVYMLQLILHVFLDSMIKGRSRTKMTREFRGPIAERRASDVQVYRGHSGNESLFTHLFAPVTNINRWLELAAHGGRPMTYTRQVFNLQCSFQLSR